MVIDASSGQQGVVATGARSIALRRSRRSSNQLVVGNPTVLAYGGERAGLKGQVVFPLLSLALVGGATSGAPAILAPRSIVLCRRARHDIAPGSTQEGGDAQMVVGDIPDARHASRC